MAREDDETTKYLLKSIKDDLNKMNDKWEASLKSNLSHTHVIKQLTTQVEGLNNNTTLIVDKVKTIETNLAKTKTNLVTVYNSLEDHKKDYNSLKNAVLSTETPVQIRAEQWKILGSLLVLAAGVVLTYFGMR